MNSTSVATFAFQPNLPMRPSGRRFRWPRTAAGSRFMLLTTSPCWMSSMRPLPRRVMALRSEVHVRRRAARRWARPQLRRAPPPSAHGRRGRLAEASRCRAVERRRGTPTDRAAMPMPPANGESWQPLHDCALNSGPRPWSGVALSEKSVAPMPFMSVAPAANAVGEELRAGVGAAEGRQRQHDAAVVRRRRRDVDGLAVRARPRCR